MADMKVIEEKLAKGEKLTAEETKEVMAAPDAGQEALTAEEEASFKDSEAPEAGKDEEATKQAEEAKLALQERAKKAGLKEDASEEEIAAAETKAKEQQPISQDSRNRLEQELAKPEGQEDLNGLTEREKGYFWDMRRERRARQQAESERDALRLERAKEKQAREAKEAVEEDPFKDRDPESPLTVQDLKKMQEIQKKQAAAIQQRPIIDVESPFVVNAMRLQENVARNDPEIKAANDIDEVFECTAEIIPGNESYLRQIAQALVKGDNVPKLVYHLIKGDPAFPKVLPVAKARIAAAGGTKKPDAKTASPEAIKAQEAMEKNSKKPNTSAHASPDPENKTAKKYGEYTADELLNMDDSKFARVPKNIRDQFLRDMGV